MNILLKFGGPQTLNSIVYLLHNSMKAMTLTNESITDSMPVQNGVKYDCIIVTTLYSSFATPQLQRASKWREASLTMIWKLFKVYCLHSRISHHNARHLTL